MENGNLLYGEREREFREWGGILNLIPGGYRGGCEL